MTAGSFPPPDVLSILGPILPSKSRRGKQGPDETRLLVFVFPLVPQRHQEHHAFSPSVGREERGHVIVEEGQPRCSEPLRVGGQVELSAEDSRFNLGRPVPPVPEALQDRRQVQQEIDVHGGVRGQRLPQAEVSGPAPEIPLSLPRLQELEDLFLRVIHVFARGDSLHGVDDEVDIVQKDAGRVQKVRGEAGDRPVQRGRELLEGDRLAGELPGGPPPDDDVAKAVVHIPEAP